MDVLEDKIYSFLPDANKEFDDDEVSNQSQTFLFAEIIREKVLHHVREELPFVTAVLINKIEDYEPETQSEDAKQKPDQEKKQRKYIRATIFVEKDNHRKIIIGKRGSLIKQIGTEARKELESILEARIYLDLYVKVKEKWRDSANVLDLIERQ